MSLETTIKSESLILTEGSMFDRLKREAAECFDPSLDHLGLVFHDKGQEVLARVYEEYIQVGLEHNLPIITLTPTWRANQDRIKTSPLSENNVNIKGASFLTDLKVMLGNEQRKILVGGLIGCKGDCYSPQEALSAEDSKDFHRPQIEELAKTDIDFLFASTLPAVVEAEGMAEAMAETDLPYVLSFVVDGEGCVLDGIPLSEAVQRIDNRSANAPICYMVNCVHPSVFAMGFREQVQAMPKLAERVLGIQGNTSARSADEFDQLEVLETQEPDKFAEATLELNTEFGTKILGGCCGTSTAHIDAIARLYQESKQQ